MSLKRTRQRKKASITSLIDVIFLLLLFFMLASTFSKHTEFELTAHAESTAGVSSTTTDISELMVLQNQLILNGTVCSDSDLVARLTGLHALTVRMDKTVTTQRLTDILMRLRTIPDLKLDLVEPK